MKQNQLRIEEGKTKLIVNHQNKDLAFLHPSYCPNTYAKVKEQIEQDNLRPANMAETASLVHAAFNSDDKYSEEIKQIMKDRWLWVFTGALYTPKLGYIQDNPETRNGMPYMDESDLIKKLEAKDPSVRTFNYGYKTGKMSPAELVRNEYVQALAGEEGAEKLADVASKFKQNPYLYSFESVDKPLTRVSALDSGWDLDCGLVVSGFSHGYDRDGSAFGVFERRRRAPKNKE